MNLIINARDAMPKGGTIAVAARNAEAGAGNPLGLPAGDYVVLAVADDGSGIPAAILEQVTEPFFTTKDGRQGHRPRPVDGLRLRPPVGRRDRASTARRAKGRPSRSGCRARSGSEGGEGGAAGAASPSAAAEGRPLRILLVDDHDAVRETTAGMLCDMGHQVETASRRPRPARQAERRSGRLRPHHHRLRHAAAVRRRRPQAGARDPPGHARDHHLAAMPTAARSPARGANRWC